MIVRVHESCTMSRDDALRDVPRCLGGGPCSIPRFGSDTAGLRSELQIIRPRFSHQELTIMAVHTRQSNFHSTALSERWTTTQPGG